MLFLTISGSCSPGREVQPIPFLQIRSRLFSCCVRFGNSLFVFFALVFAIPQSCIHPRFHHFLQGLSKQILQHCEYALCNFHVPFFDYLICSLLNSPMLLYPYFILYPQEGSGESTNCFIPPANYLSQPWRFLLTKVWTHVALSPI